MTSRAFAAALIAGGALRIAAVPSPGTGDVAILKAWSYGASRVGASRVYGAFESPPDREVVAYHGRWKDVNYPPLSLQILALLGHGYRALAPEFPDGILLTATIKLPTLAAEVGLTILLFRLVRRAGGVERGRWAALAYWLNPAALIDGAALGYLDPVVALPSLGALAAGVAGRPLAAGALLAAGTWIKPQPLLVAPALALALWAQPRRARAFVAAAAGAAVVSAAVVAPVVAAGGGARMLHAVASLAEHDMLSGDAANAWWVAGWAKRSLAGADDVGAAASLTRPARIVRISTVVEQGYPNPRPLATAVVLLVVGWAVWRAREARGLAPLAAVAAFSVHAYFVLAVGVHENHLFLAVPLLVLVAALRPAHRGVLFALSAIVALNLDFIYGLGLGVGGALPRGLTGVDATVVLAVANVMALAWHGRTLNTHLGILAVGGPGDRHPC
jgi:hypothetical protein